MRQWRDAKATRLRESAASCTVETLREYASAGNPLAVDWQQGLIPGVKILGLESRNGRTYTAECMAKAMPLYEGAKVNVNHTKAGNPRPYQDRIGTMKGIIAKPDGLYADFHFNPKHALAEQLLWDCEHSPGNVGFSHDVEAQTSRKNGRVVVEAISKVSSVDLVADPATTSGLFESRDAAAGHATDAQAASPEALDTAPPPVRDTMSRIMGMADSTPNPFLPKAAAPRRPGLADRSVETGRHRAAIVAGLAFRAHEAPDKSRHPLRLPGRSQVILFPRGRCPGRGLPGRGTRDTPNQQIGELQWYRLQSPGRSIRACAPSLATPKKRSNAIGIPCGPRWTATVRPSPTARCSTMRMLADWRNETTYRARNRVKLVDDRTVKIPEAAEKAATAQKGGRPGEGPHQSPHRPNTHHSGAIGRGVSSVLQSAVEADQPEQPRRDHCLVRPGRRHGTADERDGPRERRAGQFAERAAAVVRNRQPGSVSGVR